MRFIGKDIPIIVKLFDVSVGETFKRVTASKSIYIRTDESPQDGHDTIYCVNLTTGVLLALADDLEVYDWPAEVHAT